MNQRGIEAGSNCADMGERTIQVRALSLCWNYHEMLSTGACCMPHAYLRGAWFCLWMLNLLLLCLVSPWSCHSVPTSSSKPNCLSIKPRPALPLKLIRRAPYAQSKMWPFQTPLRVPPALMVTAWEKLPPSVSTWPGGCSFSLLYCVGAQIAHMITSGRGVLGLLSHWKSYIYGKQILRYEPLSAHLHYACWISSLPVPNLRHHPSQPRTICATFLASC